MRVLLDIVENLTSSIRFIIGTLVVGVMAVVLFMTIGASYVGLKAVDSMGERVERLGEQAIRAEQEQRRAKELAKDGWGYRPVDSGKPDSGRDRDGAKNGWGD